MTTPDADLIEAVTRGQLDALHQIWDRYARAVHWICAVHGSDGPVAHAHVVASFLRLWTEPLTAVRARSVPEHLTATARGLCRLTNPSAADSRPTRQRIDRLADVELASVALLFSGEFRVDEAVRILGCTPSDLGNSLRAVLATDSHPGRRGLFKMREVV